MKAKELSDLNVGDTAFRLFGKMKPQELRVTSLTATTVCCGPWEFCRWTGAEIDDDLNWGPPPKGTGSFLRISP